MALLRALRKLRNYLVGYETVATVEINKANIDHNFGVFESISKNMQIAPVLKSNAYGHGLIEVGEIVAKHNPPFIVVDSFFEAIRLRRAGIKTPVLVVGYATPVNILKNRLKNVSFGVTSLEVLKELSQKAKKPIHLHLKFDTGMHRQGIPGHDLDASVSLVQSNANLIVDGVFSHMGDSDNEDLSKTQEQIANWNELVKRARQSFSSAKYFHLAATHGTSLNSSIDANVVRLGLGLYGCSESLHQTALDLRPALELYTLISSVRQLEAGDFVGYGRTGRVNQKTVAATVPVGYNEGVDTRLSSVGVMKIRDSFAKIIGRVSMNITSLDVTHVPQITVGDRVQVISNQPNDPNSVAAIAKTALTIQYEILVHIPNHLRRVIV